MFSQNDFIAATRDFVCVRLESYESEEHQKLVRSFLRGAFANTAFCILAPDGETRLSRSGRGPSSLLGRRGGSAQDQDAVIEALNEIAADFREKGSRSMAVVPDFHSTRQALNVASGDQRLLLLTVAPEGSRQQVSDTLQAVLNDEDVLGKFHHDFADKEADREWASLLKGAKTKAGYFVVRADAFGVQGEVLAELSLTSTASSLRKALQKANTTFALTEKRKVYRQHVRDGKRQGIHFENGMPYGEDRDGDGVIDKKKRRR